MINLLRKAVKYYQDYINANYTVLPNGMLVAKSLINK